MVLLFPNRLLSCLRPIRRSQDEEREYLIVWEGPAPRSLHGPSLSSQPESRGLPIPDLDDLPFSQYCAQMAQELILSLPSAYHSLGPEDLKLVGKHPMAAGGSADIWEGTHEGRKVVLKSYRCYRVSFDIAQVIARFCNEVYVCNLLRHKGVDVVPLVGVYSTEEHPLGLVYEYMDNLDIKQYLQGKHSTERLKLLTGIARCLSRMHDQDIVHGNLRMTNMLIDKGGTPRIASLGDASTLLRSAAWVVEGRTNPGRLSRSSAPEVINSSSLTTKTSDMYSFGVIAWEVLTGRPPFSGMTGAAATYSMLSGARPARPDHHEISDRVWCMVERCWHMVPSKRMSAEEAVDLLEKELRRASSSFTGNLSTIR